MPEQDTARWVFDWSQHPPSQTDGEDRFYIHYEPSRGDVSPLEGRWLRFDLKPGTTASEARELAGLLNDRLEKVVSGQ